MSARMNATGHEGIREYLHFLAKANAPVEKLLLAHGKDYPGFALPKNVKKGEPQQCYRNATKLAFAREWKYCEGVAVNEFFPVPHAWCLDRKGRVIDPTWDKPEATSYRGIIIPTAILRHHIQATGFYGVLYRQHGKPNTDMLTILAAFGEAGAKA